jgi:hypothetical protein
VHPNTGPESTTSTSESTIKNSSSFHDIFANILTNVHYNVYSFLSKNTSFLLSHPSNIDILAFTVTLLSPEIDFSKTSHHHTEKTESLITRQSEGQLKLSFAADTNMYFFTLNKP